MGGTEMIYPNADHSKYYEAVKKQQERVAWIIDGLDDDKLTLKEASFVESVQKQSENGRYLSDAQMNWLEDIYKEKCR
jgi:hypothetical protein